MPDARGGNIWAVAMLTAALGLAGVADDPLRVTPEQLEANPGLIGQPVVLEGRVIAVGQDHFRLKRSQVLFWFSNIQPKPAVKPGNWEITGALRQEEGRVVFWVQHLRPLPSHLEQFQNRRRRIADGDYHQLYELAQWTEEQARLYDDAELTELAQTAYREALRAEEKSLRESPTEIRNLARRAGKLGLDASEVQRLVHKSLWLRWQQTPKDDPDALYQLADAIAADLPGTDIPSRTENASLRQHYTRQPLETYDSTNDRERLKLHRALWSEVMTAALQAEWSRQPAQGFGLARRAEQDLPERPDVARSLREKTLRHQSDRMAGLSHTQVVQIAQEALLLNDHAQAERVILDWLGEQRRRLLPQDADGRVILADQYLQLRAPDQLQLDYAAREAAAQELLVESWELAQLPAAAERLRQLGFRHTAEDGWIAQEAYERSEQAELDRLIRRGLLRIGMSADQVLQSRGREPDWVVRIGTYGRLEQQWIYQTGQQQRLYVNFVRDGSQTRWRVVSFYVDR